MALPSEWMEGPLRFREGYFTMCELNGDQLTILTGLARVMVRDAHHAEDLAQETARKLLEKCKGSARKDEADCWPQARAILQGLVIDSRRQETRRGVKFNVRVAEDDEHGREVTPIEARYGAPGVDLEAQEELDAWRRARDDRLHRNDREYRGCLGERDHTVDWLLTRLEDLDLVREDDRPYALKAYGEMVMHFMAKYHPDLVGALGGWPDYIEARKHSILRRMVVKRGIAQSK